MKTIDSYVPRRIWPTMFLICVTASLISLPANRALGQANPAATTKKSGASAQKSADADGRFNVFALKYTDAARMRELIQPLLLQIDESGTVLEDSRTNRLIVRASANAMLEVERIVKVLDAAGDTTADQQLRTKFIRFRSAPNAATEEVLQKFLSKEGRMSIDVEHNLIVVQDSAEAVAKLEQGIEQYDTLLRESVQIQNQVQRDSTIRIVWLINGIRDTNLAVPPEDLKSVVRDLSKFGVDDLRLAAQAIVKTTGGRHFEIRCSPEVGNPCEFAVEGELVSTEADASGLTVRLTATEKVPVRNGTEGQVAEIKRLCNLDATVRAPRGHTVVLGVAPTDKKTSVFVVQILAGEE